MYAMHTVTFAIVVSLENNSCRAESMDPACEYIWLLLARSMSRVFRSFFQRGKDPLDTASSVHYRGARGETIKMLAPAEYLLVTLGDLISIMNDGSISHVLAKHELELLDRDSRVKRSMHYALCIV